MEENKEIIKTEDEEKNPIEKNYQELIAKLYESRVPKEKYETAVAEHKKLLESLENGKFVSIDDRKEEPKRTADDIRKEFKKEQTNIDFCRNAVELRKTILETEGYDIFVGKNAVNDANATAAAERVAKVMEECIDESEGNPQVFNALFSSRIDDSLIPRR